MSRGIAKRYAFQGKMLTMDELADISSWSKTHLRHLINDKGIPAEKAVLPLKAELPPEKTYEYQGRKLTRSELARATGIPLDTLTYRLNKWTFEEAVKKDRRIKPGSRILKAMTSEGEKEMTIAQWAAYRDIDEGKIRVRKSRGWTDEQALEYALGPWESGEKTKSADSHLSGCPSRYHRLLKVRTPEGEKEMTIKEWASYRDINVPMIKQRLIRGWSKEQALNYAPPPSWGKKKGAKG